jgi:two-component system, cell cycle sensor histidine kinase and response regulator CckA
MTESLISVLIVEDDADSTFLIAHTLHREGGFETDSVDTLAGARRRLVDGNVDVVVLDLHLPDSQGLDTLHAILRADPDITVVVITGQLGEEMALQALNLGAEDYLLKGQIEMAVLGRTVRHAYERRRIQAAFGASDSAHTLQETLSFEQLVATISNRFISMGPHELDRAVQEALERIGGFFDVERAALYEFNRESGELQEARFWLAEQNPGLGVWPTQTEFPSFPQLNAYLDREGYFVANKTEDIPESWEAERRWAEVTGSKAGVVVRVELKGSFRGQILLDSMWRPRQWAPDVVQRLRMLGEIIAGTIVRQRAELDREQLLTRIQEQARAMQQLIETVPEGVVMLSREGLVLLANPIAQELLERLAGATTGDQIERLGDKSLAELLVQLPRSEWHTVSYNGRYHEITARPVRSDEAAGGYVLVIRDVTHEREMQERAQQQDRLAAVGQLAAGVAHDFNNIMSVITLYASGTRYDSNLPPELQKRLGIIQEQAKRAAALIEQILDFGRRTPLESLPLNLVTFLKEAVKLLQRTLPENIRVDFTHPDRSLVVSADPTRMQQAIMNLAVNARDAMPEGGRLSIQLEEVVVAQPADAPLANMSSGTWVQITVSDTGSGVPEHALPHIFEPFYTTKARGKGTGLGLAQVYGIVKQHGGEVDVRTRIGEGTTFHILLPALPSARVETEEAAAPPAPTGNGETILLVEDDDATRFALADTLEALNYNVLAATQGQEALALYEEHGAQIDLVLSDVVMPVMGGQALFHALQERNPQVKIILLTGHAMDAGLQQLIAGGTHSWMRKPPRIDELARKVAAVLER